MNVYLLGSPVSNSLLKNLLTQWNIQKIDSEEELKSTLDKSQDKVPHFIMEVSEINEDKYYDIKSLTAKYGKKIKFIVFYQILKPAPIINKLHGSEILLIGPTERSITSILINRFVRNADPLFRRWERFQLVTSGCLSLLSDPTVEQKIAVVNFGAHGAQLKVVSNIFKKKDFVALEYFSHDGKKIRMQSRISWSKDLGSITQLGVQFISREL